MSHQVRTLQTLAFASSVRGVWRGCGAAGPLASFNLAGASRRAVAEDAHADYCRRVNHAVAALSHLNSVPDFLVSKLLNFFLSFERDMAKFSMALTCALEKPTIEDVRAVLRHIVFDPEGSINRRKTIINIAFSSEIVSTLDWRFTAYFCVGLDEVLALLAAREAAGGAGKRLELRLRMSFQNPSASWTLRLADEALRGEFYQCVAMHGTTEALAHFLPSLPPAARPQQLLRALRYMLNQGVDAEKLIFFYHNLEPAAWIQILKTNFYRIFVEFFVCRKYLQMCILIFSQVYDSLEASEVLAVLNFLSVQYYGYKSYQFRCGCSNKQQMFSDYDYVFISIWKLIPLQQKKTYGPQIFKHIERFLRHLHFPPIAVMIRDEAFDDSEKRDLISAVHVHLLLKDCGHLIGDLQERSEFAYVPESLSIEGFKIFVALLNCCMDVDKYDYVLTKILPSNITVAQVNSIKQSLLTDREFLSGLVQGVAKCLVSVGNLHKFLLWANLDDHQLFTHYCQHTLFPEKMISDIYKHFMLTSRSNIHELEFFKVDGVYLQQVKRDIASDSDALFRHCAELVRMGSFRCLKNLLSIFDTQQEMEVFVRSFFASPRGAEAVYSMLIDEVYDVKYYKRYLFTRKLTAFMEFRETFVWSNNIAVEVRKLLERYGHPMSAGEVLFNKSYSSMSLSPASLEAFSLIVDANFNIFNFILNNNAMVAVLNHVILQF